MKVVHEHRRDRQTPGVGRRGRLAGLAVLAGLGILVLGAARASSLSIGPEQLRARIRSLVGQKGLSSIRWGIAVGPVGSGELLFAHNADELFVPASNRKLFVAALALHHLGPDYRFSTSLYLSGPLDNRSHFHGDLIVRGVGDPTFLNPRFHSGSLNGTLHQWAGDLAALGIRYVHGDLVMDSSGFASAERVAEGWVKDYETAQYAPRVSAICFRGNLAAVGIRPAGEEGAPILIRLYPENSVLQIDNQAKTGPRGCPDTIEIHRSDAGPDQLTVTGRLARGAPEQAQRVPVEQPERVAGEVFRSILTEKGIEVRGTVRVQRDTPTTAPAQWVRVAEHLSPPLRDILAAINKDSDNHCAEQLYQAVAFAKTGRASYPHAKKFEEGFLAEIGILPSTANFEDGCGLSRLDLVSPRAVVRLLGSMADHRHAEAFKASLAIAGRDGTIANRMGRRAIDRVFAKTGQLSVASALSGYAQTRAGGTIAFSILANDLNHRNADACFVQDRIVDWILATRF